MYVVLKVLKNRILHIVYEPGQILVPLGGTKAIIHQIKAYYEQISKLCDSKVGVVAKGCHVTYNVAQ